MLCLLPVEYSSKMWLIRNKTPGCSGLQLVALLIPDLHVYDETDCILLSISIQPSPTPTGCLHNGMTIAYQFDRERGLHLAVSNVPNGAH